MNGVKKKTELPTRDAIHSTAPTVCFLEPHVKSRALANPWMSARSSSRDSETAGKSGLGDLGFQ